MKDESGFFKPVGYQCLQGVILSSVNSFSAFAFSKSEIEDTSNFYT